MKKLLAGAYSRLALLLFAGMFGLMGYLLLADSRAATSSTSLESELGTRSSLVLQLTDSNASAGAAVKFATTSGIAKPDASNTGYASLTSTYSGSTYNSTSNATYDGVTFPDPGPGNWYTFTGSNLVFRNCRFPSDVWFEGNNVTMEHCEVTGGVSINNSNAVLLQYNNIHHWSDAVHITSDSVTVKNVTMNYNFIHTPQPICGAHSDGVQLLGVDGFTATYNFIDMGKMFPLCDDPNPLNGTFQIALDFTGVQNSNLTISNNWLNGGGYIFRLYGCGPVSRVVNNRFGRDYTWGPVDTTGSSCLADKSGNVYDDSDAPIGL